MEQVHAIMQAADKTNSPVIMQGSAGARSYAVINRHHQHAKSSLDWCRPIDLHAFLWLI
jgi:fructose/tagatose bisphosphate aldolase